jgi:hypothetical protein
MADVRTTGLGPDLHRDERMKNPAGSLQRGLSCGLAPGLTPERLV